MKGGKRGLAPGERGTERWYGCLFKGGVGSFAVEEAGVGYAEKIICRELLGARRRRVGYGEDL